MVLWGLHRTGSMSNCCLCPGARSILHLSCILFPLFPYFRTAAETEKLKLLLARFLLCHVINCLGCISLCLWCLQCQAVASQGESRGMGWWTPRRELLFQHSCVGGNVIRWLEPRNRETWLLFLTLLLTCP